MLEKKPLSHIEEEQAESGKKQGLVRVVFSFVDEEIDDSKSGHFEPMESDQSKIVNVNSLPYHIVREYTRLSLTKVEPGYFPSLRRKQSRWLEVACERQWANWVMSHEKEFTQLVHDTICHQNQYRQGQWLAYRFDQDGATLCCVVGPKRMLVDKMVETLFELDYSAGIRGKILMDMGSDEQTERKSDDQVTNLSERHRIEQWKRLSAEMFALVSPEPDKCLVDVQAIETCFRGAAIISLTPVVRQIVQESPPPTLEGKKDAASRLNRVLGELGIAIKEPTTGRPSSVAVAPDRRAGGYFRLQAKKVVVTDVTATDPQQGSVPRLSAVTSKLPPLELIEAPRQERLARPR